jgi:hypothetical protein
LFRCRTEVVNVHEAIVIQRGVAEEKFEEKTKL